MHLDYAKDINVLLFLIHVFVQFIIVEYFEYYFFNFHKVIR